MKPKVYIETTIPSYLTAWPSRDLRRAADQLSTKDWWATREVFELFVSRLVLDECRRGDADAAAERIKAIQGISLLQNLTEVEELGDELMKAVKLPTKAQSDAIHIATASVHRIDYLLTWNCSHIANASLRSKIEEVCRRLGYTAPVICTPVQLMPKESEP